MIKEAFMKGFVSGAKKMFGGSKPKTMFGKAKDKAQTIYKASPKMQQAGAKGQALYQKGKKIVKKNPNTAKALGIGGSAYLGASAGSSK